MDEVSFKDIRVLPSQLELKGNNTKTLADLVYQLQSSSILKGLVVGTTPRNEIIFHTAIGRFISPNPMGLKRGDTISIRLASQGEEILGNIIKVNNSDPKLPESINIIFSREAKNDPKSMFSQLSNTEKTNITETSFENLPQVIRGNISYFNLSKVPTGSLLYRTLLANFNDSVPENKIEFRVLSPSESIGSQLQVKASVASDDRSNKQMIKTVFGVITTENTKLKAGQNLMLEISSINGNQIASNAKGQLTEFMLRMNDMMPLLKKLNISHLYAPKPDSSTSKPIPGASIPGASIPGAIQLASGGPTNASMLLGNNIPVNADRAGKLTNLQAGNISAQGAAETQGAGSLLTRAINVPPEGSLRHNPSALSPVPSSTIQKNGTIQKDGTIMPNVAISTMRAAASSEENTLRLQSITDELFAGKGSAMSEKFIQELANSGIVISTLRIGARKLKHNLESQDTIKQDIDFTSNSDKANNRVEKYQPKGLNNILKNLSDLAAVKKMAADLATVKEIFTASEAINQGPDNWVSILVPFKNSEAVYEQEVKISYPKKNIMRFLINANFEMVGEMQLDGIIKYDKHISNPKSFDLTVRSKDRLDPGIQRVVNQIYSANQNITGVRGLLFFDDSQEFIKG